MTNASVGEMYTIFVLFCVTNVKLSLASGDP